VRRDLLERQCHVAMHLHPLLLARIHGSALDDGETFRLRNQQHELPRNPNQRSNHEYTLPTSAAESRDGTDTTLLSSMAPVMMLSDMVSQPR